VHVGASTPRSQVDDLMGTFLRRVYVLDPELRRVGFACVLDAGRGWVCVLDLIRARGGDLEVTYPADGQTDVPLAGLEADQAQQDGPGGYL
jgi:hypothetical protein